MFATRTTMVKINIAPQHHQRLIDAINDADAECETMHWTITEQFQFAVDTEGEDPIVIIFASAEGFYVDTRLEGFVHETLSLGC